MLGGTCCGGAASTDQVMQLREPSDYDLFLLLEWKMVYWEMP